MLLRGAGRLPLVAGTAASPGNTQAVVLGQDLTVELLQLWARINTELLGKQTSGFVVHGKRVTLATEPVEREHQLGARTFAKRTGDREVDQVTDDLVLRALRQQRIEPVLGHGQAQLGEAAGFPHRPRLVGEPLERNTTPQLKGAGERHLGAVQVAVGELPTAGRGKILELAHIHVGVVDVQRIAAADLNEHVAPPPRIDDATQPRDALLQRVGSLDRRLDAPHDVGETVYRNGSPGVQGQSREHSPLTSGHHTRERTGTHRRRSEQLDLHVGTPSCQRSNRR